MKSGAVEGNLWSERANEDPLPTQQNLQRLSFGLAVV